MISRWLFKTVTGVFVVQLFLFNTSQTQAAFVYDPSLNWSTLKTANFEIHFHDGEQALAKRIADICEQVHIDLTQYFDWTPQQPTQVVVSDRVDFANGFAMPIPRNSMTLYVTPADELGNDYQSWLKHLITHEYTHILHMDKARGLPKNLRQVFGRVQWFFPNSLQPAWAIEGLATYKETDREQGFGRGQSSIFKMLMRLELEAGFKPHSQVSLPLSTWPGRRSWYLYGVFFYNFLHDEYGKERIQHWVNLYSDNILPFAINSNARSAFGKDIDTLWKEFELYLRKTLLPFSEKVKQQGIKQGKKITDIGFTTGNPQVMANGDLYYAHNDFISQSKLMHIKSGEEQPTIVSEIRSAQFDVHPQQGILIAEIDAIDNLNIYFDLYKIDHKNTSKKRLTFGQRYRMGLWHPNGQQILALRRKDQQQELNLLDNNGKFISTVWQAKDDTFLSGINWSPDGKTLVAAVWRPTSLWNIERFDLATQRWSKLTNTDHIEGNPKFSSDGKTIYFVADYNGTYNIYQLSLVNQQIAQLSNVTQGITDVSTENNGSLYYQGVHAKGSDVYQLTIENPIDIDSNQLTPAKALISSQQESKQDSDYQISRYNPLNKITPTAWFPHLFIDDDRSEIGLSTFGNDPLQRHSYGLLAAYDTDNRWPVWAIDYTYDRFNPSVKLFSDRSIEIVGRSNDTADLYVSSESTSAELLFPHIIRDRQWTAHLGLIFEKNSIKKHKPSISVKPVIKDYLYGVALSYNSAKSFPLSISQSEGQRFRLTVEKYDDSSTQHLGQVYLADWRGYLTINKRQVLATRLVVGHGSDNPKRFSLGGTRDGVFMAHPQQNIVVPTAATFNRRSFALRGYDEGVISGRRMALAEIEYRFPLATIERTLTIPPIGINRLHGSVFYNAGSTWQDNYDSTKLLESVGVELNTEVIFGYFIPIDVRIGYAKGLDSIGENKTYIHVGTIF